MRCASLLLLAAACLVTAAAPRPLLAAEPEPSGWLGVALGPAPEPADDGAERAARGVQIVSIVEGSPAERAGLREGDLILTVDGLAVSSPADLIARVKRIPPGTWIALGTERRGRPGQADLRVAERPRELGALRMREGWIGVRTMDVPPSLRRHFGAPEDRGVMVWEVVDGSPARSAGLEIGDVLFEIDGQPVRSTADLGQRASRAGVGNTVELGVARDGAVLTLEVLVEKRPEDDPKR